MGPRVAAGAPFLLFLITALYMAATTEASCDPRITQDPAPYFIDGSNSSLTLTCNTEGNQFLWIYNVPGPQQNVDCKNTGKNCTYIPQLDKAGLEVSCLAFPTGIQVNCTPNIQYPPPSKPVISVTQDNTPLGKGDNLTCSVEGGHPPVESMNFNCSKPDHVGDRGVLDGDRMSSTIMMSNFTDEDRDGNMTCTCSARWSPRPALYNQTETKTVEIQFEPFIKTFSKVDSPSPSENTTLIVSCVVLARPPPTITIKYPNGTISEEQDFTNETANNVYVFNATLPKECLKDIGCKATNAITSDTEQTRRRRRREAERASATLTLNCAGQPQSVSSASLGLRVGLGVAVPVCVGVGVGIVVAVLIRNRRRQNKEQSCQPLDKKKEKRKADKKNQQKTEDEVQKIEMSVPVDATKRENRTGAYEEAWDINNITPGEKTTAIVQQVADDVPADGAVYSTVGAKPSGLGNQSTRQPKVNPGGPDSEDQTYNILRDVARKTPENIYDRTN